MSKMDTKSDINTIITSYIFDEDIEEVYKIFSDWTICEHLFLDMFTPIQFTRGLNTFEVGNCFNKNWNGTFMEFECLKHKNQEKRKLLKWGIITDKKARMEMKFSIIKNTLDNNTLLIWKCEFLNIEIAKEAREWDSQLKKECIFRWKKYLKKKKDSITQIESAIIYGARIEIWNEIINWNLFSEIGKVTDYFGPLGYKDSEFNVELEEDNLQCTFKIIKSENDINLDKWSFNLECYGTKERVPLQQIKFQLIKINDSTSFIIFEHIFKERVKLVQLEKLIKQKRDVILKFKKKLKSKSKSF